jgi:hypothetical protein
MNELSLVLSQYSCAIPHCNDVLFVGCKCIIQDTVRDRKKCIDMHSGYTTSGPIKNRLHSRKHCRLTLRRLDLCYQCLKEVALSPSRTRGIQRQRNNKPVRSVRAISLCKYDTNYHTYHFRLLSLQGCPLQDTILPLGVDNQDPNKRNKEPHVALQSYAHVGHVVGPSA